MLVPGNPDRFWAGVLCALAVPPRTVKHTTNAVLCRLLSSADMHWRWNALQKAGSRASAGTCLVQTGELLKQSVEPDVCSEAEQCSWNWIISGGQTAQA